MFDQFMGLPLHVLVLHFAVVLIPLGATATIGIMLRPAWRNRCARFVAAGNLALLALTFVTVRAGFALQGKLDPTRENVPTNDHEELGETLLWIVRSLLSCSTECEPAGRPDASELIP